MVAKNLAHCALTHSREALNGEVEKTALEKLQTRLKVIRVVGVFLSELKCPSNNLECYTLWTTKIAEHWLCTRV